MRGWLRGICDDALVRVLRLDPARRTRSNAEIFRGQVETFTVVTAEQSLHLRLSEIHFKDGAVNRFPIPESEAQR